MPSFLPGPHYLLAEEHPRVDIRRHWTILLRPGLRGGGVFAVLVWLLFLTGGRGPVAGLLTVGIGLTLCWLGWHVAQWRLDRFVVTDKRVVLLSGLLTRRVAMMPLIKVTDMTYERSWLGQLLGYGAFVLESAGQEQALHRIDHVPKPDDVAHEMFTLLFGAPTGALSPGSHLEPASEAESPKPRRVWWSPAKDAEADPPPQY